MANIKPIDQNDKLIWYRESVRYALDSGSAPGLRGQREALSGHAIDAELSKLDAEAVELVIELPDIDDALISDDDSHNLIHWWWHLGKIRSKTYPAELLPEYLRAVYAETVNP